MFDRRLLTNFDWVLILIVLLLATAGVVNLYSATSNGAVHSAFYLKQLTWIGGGLVVALGVSLFDYRHLQYAGFYLYGVNLLLLLFVLVAGEARMGATRWIRLGFMNLQPSELMKIVIIIALAYYLSERSSLFGFSLLELTIPLALIGVPVVMIMKQPDLGTALMVVFIGGTMGMFAGIKKPALIFLGGSGGLLAVGGWFLLHAYQKRRIMTFLNPELDPLGAGYHIIQSKIAVGSGSLWGRGYMHGTQSQLSFLPERHTDFAFSVFAEEWGFSGSFLLLVLYLLLILWGIYIARVAADPFGMFLAVGVTAMLFWHIVVNLAMVIGLLPVVGVPLPLFSYGGTSMLTTMLGVGVLLNVSIRRFVF
ncbi:MAG: rod shape-determining protein RodA [Desulfuromonadaceae bacterium]|nr:rod shape-determining protein RodA [Desulfuromonadaceae bacterium]